MLILLPPSEGKTPPTGRRRAVDLSALSHPDLIGPREEVLDALAALGAGSDAAKVLGLSGRTAAEAHWNLAARTASAAPAAQVYTGVLHAAAGIHDLPEPARRRASRQVRTVSALWGLVSPADRIPAYRLPMGATLPGLGPLARYWRPRLEQELSSTTGLVVDCRSADYRAAGAPPSGSTTTVEVRVERMRDGQRTVVSHDAKRLRGELVGHLLRRGGRSPRTPEQLAEAAAERDGASWHAVELADTGPTATLVLVTT